VIITANMYIVNIFSVTLYLVTHFNWFTSSRGTERWHQSQLHWEWKLQIMKSTIIFLMPKEGSNRLLGQALLVTRNVPSLFCVEWSKFCSIILRNYFQKRGICIYRSYLTNCEKIGIIYYMVTYIFLTTLCSICRWFW